MKNKNKIIAYFLKIYSLVSFLFFSFAFIYTLITRIEVIKQYIDIENRMPEINHEFDYSYQIWHIMYSFFSFSISFLFFVVISFKDLKLIFEPVLDNFITRKKEKKKIKKQEKIEKLQAQQAQINDKINELKDGK